MAHSDFVNVGKAQGNGQVAGAEVFFYLVYLAADIPAWPANEGQKFAVNPVFQYYYAFVFHADIIN
jgi:hypothetical protein